MLFEDYCRRLETLSLLARISRSPEMQAHYEARCLLAIRYARRAA